MATTLFEWDELNLIRSETVTLWKAGAAPDRKKREEYCDWLEFVLCHVYAYGWQGVEDIIGPVNVMWNGDLETVNAEIAGKTFRERVMECQTAEEALRIVDTEAHRDYNAGAFNAAKASGKSGLRKRWVTRMDDKVRDTHSYLEGVEVDLEDYFYTYTGASALYPGQFGDPEEDCNCRCSIEIKV